MDGGNLVPQCIPYTPRINRTSRVLGCYRFPPSTVGFRGECMGRAQGKGDCRAWGLLLPGHFSRSSNPGEFLTQGLQPTIETMTIRNLSTQPCNNPRIACKSCISHCLPQVKNVRNKSKSGLCCFQRASLFIPTWEFIIPSWIKGYVCIYVYMNIYIYMYIDFEGPYSDFHIGNFHKLPFETTA